MAVRDGQERREALIRILEQKKEPVSGSSLAKELQVSRQIIVQDMALLRASNMNIIATTRGYLLYKQEKKLKQTFWVTHNHDQIQEELNIMVDAGGKVLDVIVNHPVYGDISVELVLQSRKEVRDFLSKIAKDEGAPLMNISNGIHGHTVEASNKKILDVIKLELESKGFLLRISKMQ